MPSHSRLTEVLSTSPAPDGAPTPRPAWSEPAPAEHVPASPRAIAAVIGAPNWHIGDDDVLPGDGRKPARMWLRARFGR